MRKESEYVKCGVPVTMTTVLRSWPSSFYLCSVVARHQVVERETSSSTVSQNANLIYGSSNIIQTLIRCLNTKLSLILYYFLNEPRI